jgi:hypothetical protein
MAFVSGIYRFHRDNLLTVFVILNFIPFEILVRN